MQDAIYKHKKDLSDPNDNPDFDFPGWLAMHQKFSDPFVPKWVDEVKSKYGKANTKFLCTGYCYGAPYVCDQLSDKGICSAGAFAHPAFLKEAHFENITSKISPSIGPSILADINCRTSLPLLLRDRPNLPQRSSSSRC